MSHTPLTGTKYFLLMLQHYINPDSFYLFSSYLKARVCTTWVWERRWKWNWGSKWWVVSWKKPTTSVQVSRFWEKLLCSILRIVRGMFWHVFSLSCFLSLLPEPVVIIITSLDLFLSLIALEATRIHFLWNWTKQKGNQYLCDEL